MKSIVSIAFCLFAMAAGAQEILPPSQIMLRNGVALSVGTSHASPCIYDFNKDGIDDLLVGEFGDQPVDSSNKAAHAYVRSKLRIYINKGTNDKPVYDDFTYLQAAGEDAFVPVTCCISFQPRFVDLNGDGIDDIVTGSYPGDIYLFTGEKNGTFSKGEIIYRMDSIHSICPEPIDWDNDGLVDLLVSYRSGNVWLIKNKGTKTHPIWEPAKEIALEPVTYMFEEFNQKRKDMPLHAFPADWDSDGLFDLMCCDEGGDVFWYKNIGEKGKPSFSSPILLYDNKSGERYADPVEYIGYRLKVFVYDYNKDGKLDILAGDTYEGKKKVRTLTPKEEYTKAKLIKEQDALKKAFVFNQNEEKRLISEIPREKLPLRDKNYHKELRKLLPKKFVKKSQKVQEKYFATFDGIRDLKEFEFVGTGYVWVFYQK